ncbi:MAG: ribosome biogenesis GTPase Der [Verrucomicrobia bacterium]|nr:MAG: ribosome biogenesis GTPase Der [Verrucomicrobiota bacterium]
MNIAIAGRPNVGKSALFNRIAGRRIAIVHGQAGITRDRIFAKCEIGGKTFRLWDTGGIVGAGETQLTDEVRASAELAMAESDLILFVVDGQDGVNPMDRQLARLIRKLHKPVLLLVNKIDDSKHEPRADEFSALGFEDVFPTSAAHGRGVPELLEKIENFLPAADLKPETSNLTRPIAVAILIPGTTRDAVDIEYEREGKRFLFIDTAGIRARSKHSSSVEVFSVMRAEKTITRADICVLVIDAAEGIKAQDRRIAALIQDARKACVIVLNKWDLLRTKRKQRQTMEDAIANARAELFFIDYAPVLVTSALTGEHADKIFKMIERIRRAARAHIGTGKLNRALRAAFAANPPPMVKGKRLKLFYATQSSGNESREFAPPGIVLFVNSPRLLTQPFARFLEAKIRELEPYPGSPILLTLRARTSTSS